MSEMMALDAKGGMGLASARNILPLKYNISMLDGSASTKNFVASVCTVADAVREAADRTIAPGDPAPMSGAGLSRPGNAPAPLQFKPAPSPVERRASNT